MKKLISGLSLAVLVISILSYFTVPWWTYNTEVVVVNSVAIKAIDKDNDRYLVFTDKGVFENTDTWYYFKFDSSDIQSKLSKPGKYVISHYGFRIPFFSKYENIVSVK